MTRSLRITLIGLLIIAGIGVTVRVVHAITLDSVLRETEFGIQAGDFEAICNGAAITNAINQFQSGYVQRFLEDIPRQFTQTLRAMFFRLAQCYAGSFIGFGSGPAGAQSCTSSIGGAIEAQLKQQYLTKFRSDFLANCTARVALNSALDVTAQILAQGGREGGPAFVQDWRALQAESRYRGLQVARNQMANTNYCPWLRGYLAGYFNFDPGQGVALSGEYEDGLNSYSRSAECSLPPGFDPLAPEWQTTEAVAALTLPTNSIWGSYLLAQENIQEQVAAEELADEREFVSTGGIGALRATNPETGTSCEVMAADGTTCLKYSAIKQPSGGLAADVQAARQSQYDWISNSRAGNNMMQDVRLRMFTSLLDATSRALDTEFQADLGVQDVIDNPSNPVDPPPGYTPGGGGSGGGPGEGDPSCAPNAPDCTGGNPDCQCVRCNSDAQAIAQTVVLQATLAACLQHPEYVNDAASCDTVIPGNERLFLIAICETSLLSPGTCHPHPAQDDEVVISAGGLDYSIDVITADGAIRKPGRTIAACLPGVQ